MKTECLRRSLALLLSVLLLLAVPALALPATAAEDGWLLHYDFAGSTDAERLSNKAGGDTPSLTLTGADSAVRDGAAYVSTKAGNYLSAPAGSDVKRLGAQSTLFLCFRAEGDDPNSVADIVQLGNVFRVALDMNNRIFTRIGNNVATDSTTQRGVSTVLARNAWIYLALTLEIDGTTVKETIRLSTDEGQNWTSTEYTLTNVAGMYPAAGELLLGKVSKGIPDRGTSFTFRDVRLSSKALTVAELQAIRLPAAPADPEPEPTPEEPDPEPRSDLSPYLVAHYDFLGDTDAERLADKAPSGVSREDLLIYSSLDADGNKLTKLNGDGTVTVDSRQANLLFALAGEDITSITEGMTVFAAFQVTQKDYGSDFAYNPCAIAAIDNNLRFSFHNIRQIFTKLGTNYTLGGAASGGNLPWGQWIWAAVSLKWNRETGTVTQKLFVSLDEGESYTAYSASTSGITTLFSNATYLSFGKLAPGMADRGTSFLYKDIRIWNTALTEAELKSVEVEEYQPDQPEEPEEPEEPQPPVVNPDNPNPFEPVTGGTTEAPETPTAPVPESPSGKDTDALEKPQSTGCEGAVGLAPCGVLLLGGLSFLRRKRRNR